MLDAKTENKVIQILSVFETGQKTVRYDGVYVMPDGKNKRRQVTLSYGFTEDGGNLSKVLQFYILSNGRFAYQTAPFVEKIGTGTLYKSDTFKALLKEAAQKDPFFNACQDFAFRALYLKRGYEKAEEFGIETNLGKAVIIDSVLHGSLDYVANLFSEARPSRGGDEKIFIKAYLNAREKWLSESSALLADTVYRVRGFREAVKMNDWDLLKPFDANGTLIQ